jgi:hypothetical protein
VTAEFQRARILLRYAFMRRMTPVPSKSLEVLVLESPEAFAAALLARPPLAEQNHLIARDRGESLRRFSMRVLHRLRRMLAGSDQIAAVSYLFTGDAAGANVRARLLRAISAVLCRRGALRLIGPHDATGRLLDYMDALGPRLPEGTRLEANLSPTGWTIMSARGPRREETLNRPLASDLVS